ncbi:hypothetical protein [Fusibacter sp. 3D3]|uniref:hypothetical protein n=1 Tax=Fusibacter sp. 3D3 TaxID=1048380 RepID=UPI0008539E08|nr:hypothetical protein [Fusibacter sp. 3D3]GAU76035.1 hypothetical protein F3D3_0631 [Fusibacter sp. 3D3]
MYRQFVKNMDWYLKLNADSSERTNDRFDLAKRLEPLKDIQHFKRFKIANIEHYKELQHVI